MEINDLKSVWKKANDQEKAGYWVSQEDVKAMFKKKSQAAISDVRRQMKQKVLMTTVVGLLSLAIGVGALFNFSFVDDTLFDGAMTGPQYGLMMIVMSVSILIISIHARIRLKQVRVIQESADSLKIALTKTKEAFQKIIRFGTWSDATVTPIVVVFVAAISVYQKIPFSFDERLLYLILIWIVSSFAFYRLGKYLMNRRFGRFVRALNDRLAEFDAVESEEDKNNQQEL